MRHSIFAWMLVGIVALSGCSGEKPITPEPPETLAPAEPSEQQMPVSPPPEPESQTHAVPPWPPVDAGRFITASGQRFIDTEGREILLHGVNVVDKSPQRNYLSWHSEADFARLRDWGMNVIRLGIIWDGLEPEPGVYDDAYLAEMDQRVAWAANQGLYVVFDMHQDLFSVRYADGAPEWATLTDDQPHISQGDVWSDAYFTSPAIQRAVENFWANQAAPDGVGIQDHYAAAWRRVAERYAGNPAVIGYDLMNEPFPGTAILLGQSHMIGKAAELLRARLGEDAPTAEQIIAMWLQAEERGELMRYMDDVDFFAQVMDASAAAYEEFEKTQLMGMYQRVADAIREVDTNHILFLEPNYASNAGVYSHLQALKTPDGRRDALQAYAPHGYDLVVDTPHLALGNNARVNLIFTRHRETAERLEMPMLVGEWGAFGGHGADVVPAAWGVVDVLESLGCSDTYWEYGEYLPGAAYLPALQRAIPVRLAGTLLSYDNDIRAGTFTCTWHEDPAITAPTILYIPASLDAANKTVALTPEGSAYSTEAVASGSPNQYYIIPGAGVAAERTLSVR